MSIDYLTSIFSKDEDQPRGYAIVLILCTLCLAEDIAVVITGCNRVFITGDDCAVGIGYFGIAAICIAFGIISVWGLYRAWRAGHLKNFKFF